jgi:hypothetical protein
MSNGPDRQPSSGTSPIGPDWTNSPLRGNQKTGVIPTFRMLIIAVSAIAICTGIWWLLTLGAVMPSAGFSAAAFIVIAILPWLIFILGWDRSCVPFLPLIGSYYLVFFALPIFAAPLAYSYEGKVVLYVSVALEPIRASTVLLATAGVAAMFVAFYTMRELSPISRIKFRLKTGHASEISIRVSLWFLLIGALTYRFVPILHSIPSIGQFFGPIDLLALGGLYLFWQRKLLSQLEGLIIVFICVPLDLYSRARDLLLTELFLVGLFMTCVLWRERQFIRIGILGTIGVLLVAAYSTTVATRSYPGTLFDRLSAGIGYFQTNLTQQKIELPLYVDGNPVGPMVTMNPRISPLVNRLGQIWLFQMVDEMSPVPVPYLSGETYRPLLTAFIPRLIYPNKLEERAGGMFGHRYGLLNDTDVATSVNIPWLVELLANFGPLGVIGGMSIFGLLLAILDRLFNRNAASDLEFLIGLTIWYKLIYQESNFSVMTGTLLPHFAALYLYFRFGPPILDAVLRKVRIR